MVREKLITLLQQQPGEFQLYRLKADGSRKIVVLSEEDWAAIVEALRYTKSVTDRPRSGGFGG